MPNLSELVTVLVVTSPIASDPSIETIAATFESIYAQEVFQAPVLVGCDGVRPEQRALNDAYEKKVVGLRDYLDGRGRVFDSVLRLPQWGHQANVMRMLLEHVTTPLILFVEHDTPLIANVEIDWEGCAQTLIDGELHLIRFHHESHVLPEHAHLMIGDEDRATRRIPYLRTVQWSQRPHLARTDWYRQIIDTYFARSSRCMIEDLMYGVVHTAYREEGPAAWLRWKLALYADMEPTMQRSYHLDGRAGGDKYEMVFAYPGDNWPQYAPAPTLSRVF